MPEGRQVAAGIWQVVARHDRCWQGIAGECRGMADYGLGSTGAGTEDE